MAEVPTEMHNLLGARLRVTLADGRVLTGHLHCLDWKQNILLRDSFVKSSFDEIDENSDSSEKFLGLIAIEAKDVVKYERKQG